MTLRYCSGDRKFAHGKSSLGFRAKAWLAKISEYVRAFLANLYFFSFHELLCETMSLPRLQALRSFYQPVTDDYILGPSGQHV